MNQIEVLKNISEFGNPKNRPEVLKYYNQYKSDPTFRSLAISLAESETGYSSLDDSTKKAYQSYKDSLISPKPVPQNVTQVSHKKDSSITPFQDIKEFSASTKPIVAAAFPRLAEAQVPDYSKGVIPGLKTEATNIVKGILDIGSLPGRVLSTGINVGYDKARGLPTNDLQQLSQQESDNIVEDVVRSPFSIVPGVGEVAGGSKLAQGLGKLVSKTPGAKILTKPATKAIGKGLESTAENVLIGRAENIANDRDISGGLGKDILLGSIAGILPAAGKFVKEKNISDVLDVARKSQEKIPDQAMKDFMGSISDRETIEAALGKNLDDMWVKAKADGLAVGELPKDFIGRYKKYNEILEKRGIGSHLPDYSQISDKKTPIVSLMDLATGVAGSIVNPAFGAAGYGLKKGAELLSDKAPTIERSILPLTENLFTPQVYRAVTREKISDKPGNRN